MTKIKSIIPPHRVTLLSLVAAFSILSATSLSAFTSGEGTADNPFIVSAQDSFLDSGNYYLANSSVDFGESAALDVGVETSNNFLTISGNGTVIKDYFGSLGSREGSSGTVLLSGDNVRWENKQLTVGTFGKGALIIDSGAHLIVGTPGCVIGAMSPDACFISVSGANSVFDCGNGDISLGSNNPDGMASLIVDAGAQVSDATCYVGGRGFGNVVYHANGTLLVSGPDTTMTNSEGLYIGWINTGHGSVVISAGAKVTNSSTGAYVFCLDNGDVTVTGQGTVMNNLGDTGLGMGGVSDMHIEDGAKVTSDKLATIGGSSLVTSPATGESYTAKGEASLLITGNGSSMLVRGGIYLGNSAFGRIDITDGGILTTSSFLYAGTSSLFTANDCGTGVVNIDGTGSVLTCDILYAGGTTMGKGNGTINITNGGCLNQLGAYTNGCTIGYQGKGEINVSGSGSALLLTGSIMAGTSGTGTLTVSNGALTSVYGHCAQNPDSDVIILIEGETSAIRLANGYLAIKGSFSAEAVIQAGYHLKIFNGNEWVDATADDLTTTYFDGTTNVWSQNDLFATYGNKVDLTGYTLINGGVNNTTPAWVDSDKDSGTWHRSPWYGWVSIEDDADGWTYHVNHGWQYVYDLGNDSGIVLWDMSSDSWWFTSKDFYPDMYNMNKSAWLYYYGGISPNRWFYDYKTKTYVKESVEFAK